MVTVTTLPYSRPLSRLDLEPLPDDGHGYELVDGALVVTPAPSYRHQHVVVNLLVVLKATCPPDLTVLVAPFDVVLAHDTVLQPDLLVARRRDITERDLPGPPLLAVEVLSSSTRLIDLNLKRARHAAARCPSYWVVDPHVPSVTAWELEGSEYVEAAHAIGDDQFDAAAPYPVAIVPAQLVE